MRAWLLLLTITPAAFAYEVDTHGRMTQTAFERSSLKLDASLLTRLGFDRLDLKRPLDSSAATECDADGAFMPLRDAYTDARPAWTGSDYLGDLYFRCPNGYEKRLMPPPFSGRIPSPPELGATPELRFESWLMRGAIREDDVEVQYFTDPSEAPDVDPWGEITRPTHHFYSPVTNTSDSLGTQNGLAWVLGVADPFAASPVPDPARENHFSYVDAVRGYHRALTFESTTITNATIRRQDSRARMALWAGTLKSLGHVVHLLQDMAQPQHVRGERHNYVCHGVLSNFNQDKPNRTYENFSNYRVAYRYNREVEQAGGTDAYVATIACEEQEWLDMFAEAGYTPPPASTPFTTSSYPLPSFALARKFFTTRNAGDPTSPVGLGLAINGRAGLADYTNRGFYSQDYGAGAYLSPPAIETLHEGDAKIVNVPDLGDLRIRALYWTVPDNVAPAYQDPGRDTEGRAPIASANYWSHMGLPATHVLTLANYTQMADMLGPRAIAYSAGLIDYFFRGKLEVQVPDQGLIAVINQGEIHSVDADGYPRRGDQSIFGFTRVRLKVRNATAEIVESGTATHSVQNASAGQLVAVARYHRNACYKTDLTGQRAQGYAAVPPAPITAPACTPLLPERTDYEEISVSAPLTIAGGDALPGMVGSTATAWVDKTFDFSADPIPVNATDLFVQLVYRGQLGEEPDGIAVGRLDVREPTLVTVYNGSDYRWTGSVWMPGSVGTTTRAADFLHICSGSPSKLIYRLAPSSSEPPALSYGLPPTLPGAVRLAVLTTMPTANRVFRGQPTMIPSPSAEYRIFTSKGSIRQAGRELVSAAAMAAPLDCTYEPVAGSDSWCNQPSQRRRGQILGDAVQPIYYAPIGSNATIDVDAAGLPTFVGLNVRDVGQIRFDDEPQIACPAPPAKSLLLEDFVKLQEQAAAEGIDWR